MNLQDLLRQRFQQSQTPAPVYRVPGEIDPIQIPPGPSQPTGSAVTPTDRSLVRELLQEIFRTAPDPPPGMFEWLRAPRQPPRMFANDEIDPTGRVDLATRVAANQIPLANARDWPFKVSPDNLQRTIQGQAWPALGAINIDPRQKDDRGRPEGPISLSDALSTLYHEFGHMRGYRDYDEKGTDAYDIGRLADYLMRDVDLTRGRKPQLNWDTIMSRPILPRLRR